MEKSYKLIDGVLYAEVDTTGVNEKLDEVLELIKPYKSGIDQCKAQIEQYEAQINSIIAESGLDKEVVKAIAPEKASFLGW